MKVYGGVGAELPLFLTLESVGNEWLNSSIPLYRRRQNRCYPLNIKIELNTYDGMAWIRLIWLRIWEVAGCFEHGHYFFWGDEKDWMLLWKREDTVN
jgi:hypothetical protein